MKKAEVRTEPESYHKDTKAQRFRGRKRTESEPPRTPRTPRPEPEFHTKTEDTKGEDQPHRPTGAAEAKAEVRRQMADVRCTVTTGVVKWSSGRVSEVER